MRLELVSLPSTDVDRSKAFYVDRVGFNVDHDVEPGNGMRGVQLTPPGSVCSIVIGVEISDPQAAAVLNLHLVVDDVDVARRTVNRLGGIDDAPIRTAAGTAQGRLVMLSSGWDLLHAAFGWLKPS